MNYRCTFNTPDGPASWISSIRVISHAQNLTEADITGRGSSFQVITGTHSGGRFLCVPNWGIGCGLSRLDDTFWNSERLAPFLNHNPIDLVTLIQGLSALSNIAKPQRGGVS